jgi:hypothetical protein
MQVVILGNPENRRVTHFQEALKKEGWPEADVCSWTDFLNNPSCLDGRPDVPTFLRIDSCGENQQVEQQLLESGFPQTEGLSCRSISPSELRTLGPAHGRLLCPRQVHLGFEQALQELGQICRRKAHWKWSAQPDSIATCFNKAASATLFRSLGIGVPEQLEPPENFEALIEGMRSRQWTSAFVKLSCGSSASGLGVFSTAQGGPRLHTTVEAIGYDFFNTLKVRTVTKGQDIQNILEFILGEGAVVERAVPKARLKKAYFDLRVLCIAGEPRFFVVRQNTHPITNLHLGGWRGDFDALRALVADEHFENMLNSCRLAARALGMLHVGLDVLFEPGFERHRIIEANAFGDLLPRLEVQGRDVWQWQVAQLNSLFG